MSKKHHNPVFEKHHDAIIRACAGINQRRSLEALLHATQDYLEMVRKVVSPNSAAVAAPLIAALKGTLSLLENDYPEAVEMGHRLARGVWVSAEPDVRRTPRGDDVTAI